ncbi:uncharacterized protein LOC116007843 [Ipomoea triloba]|uniref:uncharacterized protein LOC116007843 n=1 Tax=Ipomoea triloba TaxID=35885 RepID=UPI00125DFDD9|nr:uncharacterized protein LOC116007843 [Ipomoea triloba]
MGITKQKFGNEREMSIYELFHYSFFPGLFVAFTYNKKQPPVFGAAPAFFCILLSFLGLSFRHIPNNLSNYNVLTANSPFFYQISGTWSNHEGSILSWCRILSFYGFLLCYRGRPQSHNVSKRGGHRETFFYSFVSNFVKNSILSLPRYEQKSGAAPQLYTPFVLRTLVDSELRSRRNRTFDGPAAPLYPERKMSFAPLGARRSRDSREGKITHSLYITDSYFKEHNSLTDSKFEDYIAQGIAYGSCELLEELKVGTNIISVHQKLIGEGSHRHLSLSIRLESLLESKSGSQEFCEAIIIERLPSGVFADLFELQHLVQRGVFTEAGVFGDTNLELPSFRSNRSLIEVHLDIGSKLSPRHKDEVEFKIELPLHARYQVLHLKRVSHPMVVVYVSREDVIRGFGRWVL